VRGDETEYRGDEEGECELRQVIAVRRLIEARQQVHQAPPVDEHDRQDRARLDGDVEELRALPEPALSDEQMSGAGDGQELGDPLDDAQEYGVQGVGHGCRAFR
jgi:hypothetical protein